MTPNGVAGIVNEYATPLDTPFKVPSLMKRYDRYFSTSDPLDSEPKIVYFEQERLPATCAHSIEFWVAVRSLDGSDDPIVMQLHDLPVV